MILEPASAGTRLPDRRLTSVEPGNSCCAFLFRLRGPRGMGLEIRT